MIKSENSAPLRVALIGTVTSSLVCLQALFTSEANVVAVVTKKTSPYNADYTPLAPFCLENSIPYFFWTKENPQGVDTFLKKYTPEVIFCVGWSHLLGKNILELAPLGVIGFHPAPLPKGRGRHPLIWAIVLGLATTDSCFFFMNEDIDSGDVLSRLTISIDEIDTSQTLMDKLMVAIRHQIPEIVCQLKNNTSIKIPQNPLQASYWRKRLKADGQIDFRMSAQSISNLVRALSHPYIGAHFCWQGRDIKVWKASCGLASDIFFEPGLVIDTNNNTIHVKCGGGSNESIILEEHECLMLPQSGDYLL